ncbi:DUF4159 domain-containing protein [bacterium]|nr:DUF4159 domain-containing protein [bacterium]
MKKTFLFFIFLLFIIFISPTFCYECGKAPPTRDVQRRKAAESFPPLPLPATPVRRTEKKNPPAPPVLVGKVLVAPNAKWTRAEMDVENLLKLASSQLGIPHRSVKITLSEFSFDPDEVPVLYITSVEPFVVDASILPKLKSYLERGGFIWANASSGSNDFTKGFLELMSQIYPEKNLYPIYSNHPLNGCFHNLTNVKIMKDGVEFSGKTELMVLNLGCRAAVILSPFDLGCGWAMHTHPWGSRYVPEDAIKIGVNMFSYTLGWIETGRLYGQIPVFAEKTEKKGGRIYIGQIIHSGDWDPHPSSLGKLLVRVARDTESSVYIEKLNIDLKKETLENIPLLYITGHFDPKLSKVEKQKLRKFLLSGGALISDSCCGSKEFSDSFKLLISEILPEAKNSKWDINHSLYNVPFKTEKFIYTFNTDEAPFEIYHLKGLPSIIFSPYSFGSGWEGIPRPYVKALSDTQSIKLGVNVITYLITH